MSTAFYGGRAQLILDSLEAGTYEVSVRIQWAQSYDSSWTLRTLAEQGASFTLDSDSSTEVKYSTWLGYEEEEEDDEEVAPETDGGDSTPEGEDTGEESTTEEETSEEESTDENAEESTD